MSVSVSVPVIESVSTSVPVSVPVSDSLVVTKMFLGRSASMHLNSPSLQDPLVKVQRERMADQLHEAVKPLHQYIRLFDDYVEFLNTDVSEYVRSYEERNLRYTRHKSPENRGESMGEENGRVD